MRTLIVTEVRCPEGARWDGARSQCVGQPQCPPGTAFVERMGCVSEIADPEETAFTGQAASLPVTPGAPPPPIASGQGSVPPPPPRTPLCQCKAGDLMCAMKCSAICGDRPMGDCYAARVPQPTPAPVTRAGQGKEPDRAALKSALAAARDRAMGCTTMPGTASVRVVFAPSGRVTSSSVIEGSFAGTPQGGCIATTYKAAVIPPFDGADMAVTTSLVRP